MDISALRELPILNGIISETLRYRPPVANRAGRITGPSGLVIAGQYIQPSVEVVVSQLTVQRDPRYWYLPDLWRPERWIEPEKEEVMDTRPCKLRSTSLRAHD